MKNEKEVREFLVEFLSFVVNETAPRLDGFTPHDWKERYVNKFMFKLEAKEKLDDEARAEGFENAVDKATKKLAEAKEKEAIEEKEKQMQQKAKDDAAAAIARKEAIEAKELELQQMKEQAELAARQQAERIAKESAEQNINV